MKKDKYYKDLEEKGYYDTIDKRSKDYREYKQWKAKQRRYVLREGVKNMQEGAKKANEYKKFEHKFKAEETTGLGDVVEKITEVTGIKKVVKAVFGDDCGCDERKDKFNKVPMWKRRNINCISEEDYNWYVDNNIATKKSWKHDEVVRITQVYNSVFKTNIKVTKCGSCVRSRQQKLNEYIKIYNS